MAEPHGADEPIAIATIGKARGLKGECRIYPLGRTLATLDVPHRVMVGREGERLEPAAITALWDTPAGMVCSFEGVGDREGAERLRNLTVFVRQSELPPLEQGEYYHFELTGLRVMAVGQDDVLGTVKEVHNYPTVDALEVESKGGETWLLPLRKETVSTIDTQAGVVRVYADALEELL